MRFNRVANINTANYTLERLKVVPKHLINIVREQGIQIYCFNEKLYPSYIGLDEKSIYEDGRSSDETSCFIPSKKVIELFDWDCDEEKGFSVALHEFAHALDYSLGMKIGKDNYLSCVEPKIYKGWQNNKALDWYADLNPCEYFAQAFMAFFQDIPTYKTKSYRSHTKEELFLKDNDMYNVILNLNKVNI